MPKTKTNCEIRKCKRADMCGQCKNNPPNERDHTLCTGPDSSSKKRKKNDSLICPEKIPKNLYTDPIPRKKTKKCSSLSDEQNLNSDPIPNLISDASPKKKTSKRTSKYSYQSPSLKKRGKKYSDLLNYQNLNNLPCQKERVEEYASSPNSIKLHINHQDVEMENGPLYFFKRSFSFFNDDNDDIFSPGQNLYPSSGRQKRNSNFETSPESKIEMDLGIQGDQKLLNIFFKTKVNTEGVLAWPKPFKDEFNDNGEFILMDN